jgi:hypothetical protein
MGALQKGVRALLVGGFAALMMAGAAAAQTIAPGASVNGQLTSSDAQGEGGQHQDVYTLRGRAGQALRINLDSDNLDTLVRVTGPSNFSAQDDDTGELLNAQLEITLPANGEYRIVATTFGAGATGNYTLRVTEIQASQVAVTGANGGELRIGQPVSGSLTANDPRGQGGQHQDVYTFTGRAGQTLRVNLDSNSLDTLVRVTGPSGFSQEDDDSGDLLNAQLDIALPANGQYRVIATTYSAGATGDYTLRVSESDPRQNAATAAATGAIRVGQSVNGALRAGDPTRSSGQYADAYTFEGQQGQTVEIRLSSGAYDPFLSISGPGNFQADNDDDIESNEPLRNSRLVVTLPQTGQYRIQATSFSSGSTGDYRLSVAQASAAAAAQASQGEVLAFGQVTRGRLQQGDGQLRSGEFSDAFRFLGQAGQRVAIEMRSTEIDPYIILQPPEGDQVDNDDFEGLGTNSRIEMTLAETGEFHVLATTYQPGETGSYEIVVTDLSARREAAAPPATAAAPASNVANNQATNGALASNDPTLTEGQHYDLYTFTGRRGQNVSIDLTSSTFDTFLMLVYPSGEGAEDDDGVSGTTNSRITGGLPEDGEYTVVVTSYSPGATGNYSLRMNLGAASASNAQPPASVAQGGQAGRVFLLSVGISDYAGFANNLDYTADDARNLYTALQQSGSLAQGSAVLTDAQATMANVRSAFQRIAAQAGPNDLFFFFYSGHGAQDDATAGGELDERDEFLVMRDGLISDNEMAQMFRQVRARLSVIALDSCFSGGFARDVVSSPRIMGLFSSDEDLTSAVAGKFQAGGYLSHFLRTAFMGEADENRDRSITAGELHTYLWRRFASEQNIGAQSMDGERNYQRLVVDRGGVKIDDVVIALGR